MKPRQSIGRGVILFVLLAALSIAAGCASTSVSRPGEDQPQQRVKLIRTQSDDRVTLQWDSEADVLYSVVYTTSLTERRPWKAMQDYTDLQGTGSTMTIVFTSPEPGSLYYRLIEKHRGLR